MRTIAVTSGKGGVGKTNVSANLAIALSARGKRVIVFDADIGLANLDVVLGTKTQSTLQQVLSGEKTLLETIHQGPGRIRYIPGGSGVDSLFSLTEGQSNRFFSEFAALEADTDFLIVDTGAGIDSNVMTFLKASDEVLVILTPDPASLTDGYAMAKALYAENKSAKVKLIINMVTSELEAKQVFSKLSAVGQQFLGVAFEYGGFVRMDAGALALIRKRVPFYLGNPNLPASQDVANIAARLLGAPSSTHAEDLVSRLKTAFGWKRSQAA